MRVRFLDRGQVDDKWVARLDGQPLRCVDHLMLRVFFAVYGAFKRLRQRLRGLPGRTGAVSFERLP